MQIWLKCYIHGELTEYTDKSVTLTEWKTGLKSTTHLKNPTNKIKDKLLTPTNM